MHKIILTLILTAFYLSFSSVTVIAGGPPIGPGPIITTNPGNPGSNAMGGPELCEGTGIPTAIGCIPVGSTQALATFFLRWGMGIAGGIALALIGYSGILIITASGDPKKVQAGQELLTAAVSGVGLLLFGTFALRFGGIDILGLDQFGFGTP